MAAAAALAAAQRNARNRKREQEKEEKRNARRIKNARDGLTERPSIPSLNLDTKRTLVESNAQKTQRKMTSRVNANAEKRQKLEKVNYNSLSRFEKVSHHAMGISVSDQFNVFIISVIFLAGLLVGLQTYPQLENQSVVSGLDTFVLSVFVFEVAIKVLAEGRKPWRYFTGPEWMWNCFDFLIVFMSMPFFDWGSSIQLLRLVRLLRLVKLVKRIPQLYMIVMGLVGGMKAIMYILILLVLIFYMYAVLGFYLFSENDPFHFGDIWRAMLTLWRLSTFEDWTDVLYTSYYSCEVYPGNIYRDDAVNDTNEEIASLFGCTKPKANEAFAVLYFISFVFVSSLVMLSLFVGAVTMSMTESMEQLKAEKEIAHREKTLQKARERTISKMRSSSISMSGTARGEKESNSFCASDTLPADRRKSSGSASAGTKQNTDAIPKDRILSLTARPSHIKQLGLSLTEDSDQSLKLQQKNTEKENVETEDVEPEPKASATSPKRRASLLSFSILQRSDSEDLFDDKELRQLRQLILSAVGVVEPQTKKRNMRDLGITRGPVYRTWEKIAEMCENITEARMFNNFVTLIILLAGFQIGISTFPQTQDVQEVLTVVDAVILVMFSIEVILKTIAERFKPWQYFYHRGFRGWNIFDYIVVAGSFIPGSGGSIQILRLLRLLRVLKLLKALPELQVIVVALMNGVSSISYIALILFMFFYIFAIAGQILFAENDPWHYQALHVALLTLFRSATLEDWSDLAYISMYGCHIYGYEGMEDQCVSPKPLGFIAAAYYVLFTLIGGLVLMTLFIGVVTMSMEEASSEQKEHQMVRARAERLRVEMNLTKEQVRLYEDVFNKIDLDGGGSIDEEELAIGFIAIGEIFDKEEIKRFVAIVDTDNSGELDFAEFIEFMEVFRSEFLERTDGGMSLMRDDLSVSIGSSNKIFPI